MIEGMINYALPDFTSALGLNLHFARLAMERPEIIRPGVRIDNIYGCFPGCPLNGGRAVVRERASREQVHWTFGVLAEYGLYPRLTLTNMLAGEAEMDDPYSQMILEEAAAAGAWAIVYSDEIARLVRERYGLPLVLSTTREILDIDELNRALEAFDCVVLNYNLGKDADFLARVKTPGKLEVMVNEYCQPHCPNRARHYQHITHDQLNGTLTPFHCPATKPSFFDHEPGHPILFTADEVEQTAKRFGIPWFKIVGRGTGFETNLEALSHYLIRPEYQPAVKRQVQAMRSS